MKQVLGVTLYVSAAAIGLFATVLLVLQIATTIGLMKSDGKEPGLFFASACFFFGGLLVVFLLRLGTNVLQNKNRLSGLAKTNLLIILTTVDVVIFLKSVIPFLTQGHGIWSGTFTILSVITFAALCWMFTKI